MLVHRLKNDLDNTKSLAVDTQVRAIAHATVQSTLKHKCLRLYTSKEHALHLEYALTSTTVTLEREFS